MYSDMRNSRIKPENGRKRDGYRSRINDKMATTETATTMPTSSSSNLNHPLYHSLPLPPPRVLQSCATGSPVGPKCLIDTHESCYPKWRVTTVKLG